MFRRSFVLGARGRATTVVVATAGLIASGVVAAVPAMASTVWYVGGTGASDANTCLDPSTPCATVNGVLAKSGFTSGDTIDVAEGTYAQRPVFGTKGANVVGLGAGAIFDGGNLGNASTMAVTGAVTVGLTNLTLRNGTNTGSPYGGNLRIQAGTVNASNVTITGGSSQYGGGVVQYAGTTFVMNGGSISGNKASSGGGALYSNGGTTTLTGVAMNQNTSSLIGGAVGLASAATKLNVTGGSVNQNTALNGGALYNVGVATFDGTTLTGNTANGGSTGNAGNGGAIFNVDSVTITDSATLSGNQAIASTATSAATGWGGAIFSGPLNAGIKPTLTINNSTISGGGVSGNNATVGGAIANAANVFGVSGTNVVPSVLNATGLTVSQNTATLGGGVYNGATATLTGSSLQGNQATSTTIGYGGGLYAAAVPSSAPAPVTTVDSTNVSGNSAGVTGGGLATNGPANTTIRNGSVIDNNTSSRNGGGVTNSSTMTITGSDVSGNSASSQGGGIYNGNGATATITGSTVDTNTAANSGGGIFTNTTGTLSLSGGEVSSNSAGGGGGVLVYDNGSATLDGTSLTNNTATSVGGGAIFNAGTTTASHVSIIGNHGVHNSGSSGVGAGIYSGTPDNNVSVVLRVTASTIANNDGYGGSAVSTNASGTGTTGKAAIDNSTITGNTNTSSSGAIATLNPLTLTNSTVTSNTANGGAGGLVAFNGGPISLAGDIVASNSGTECGAQSPGLVVDGGYNLADSTARCAFGAADFVGSPQLGALANNGGPTQTELPGPASAALDRIAANTSTTLADPITGTAITLCGSGATDQRGTARPQGANCDIGSVEVVQVAPTVSGPASATFTVGTAGTPVTFTTTGTPQAKLTESGTLPAGVTFKDNGDGTATISGTPSGSGGQFPITVTATNEAGSSTANFTLILDQAPSVSGSGAVTFVAGTAGSTAFTTSGYPTPTLSESGTLPSGITFVDNGDGTGTLAGTASTSAVGSYTITIMAHNGVGSDATKQVTIQVAPPLSITTTTLGAGAYETSYSGTVTASGGISPYSFAVTAGALPTGLSLATNGTISGVPTAMGTFNFTVTATDSNTTPDTATANLSITIGKGATTIIMPTTNGANINGTLTGGSPAIPIAGATIVFTAKGTNPPTTVCTAVTTSTGTFHCTMSVLNLTLATTKGGVTATYAGSTLWLGSTATAAIGP